MPATREAPELLLAAAELPRDLALAWSLEWRAWFGPARTPLARAAHKGDLARVETPLGPVVAKRERVRGWKRPLARLGARRTRSERALHHARHLLASGLPTPAPLAVLGRPDDAVLVTRYVEGVGPWELCTARGVDALLGTLAAALARLHAAGFRHRDLKASNLLFRTDGAPEIVWTDLDALRPLGTVEPRVRAHDLARLEASFASAAARASGVRADHWRRLIELYLERSLGRPPTAAELDRFLVRTHVRCERHIRRHLGRGESVH